MRMFCAVLMLAISVAGAAEPPARIDPVMRGSAAVTTGSLNTASPPASGSVGTAGASDAAVENSSDRVAFSHGTPAAAPAAEATVALEHLQGERSRLEAEKQLLSLRVDIATLHRKLLEMESPPRSVPGAPGPAVLPAEPPPTVLSRRGFDGHFTAVLKMSAGGKLLVRAGDNLPNGKVEAVDSQGVTVSWYGRRQRLLDADVEDGNTFASAHNLDLTLPATPMLVTAH